MYSRNVGKGENALLHSGEGEDAFPSHSLAYERNGMLMSRESRISANTFSDRYTKVEISPNYQGRRERMC